MLKTDYYYVADSRVLLQSVETDSVDLIVTDPPYGIGWRRTRSIAKKPIIAGDTPAESRLLLRALIPELARVLKPGGTIYVFLPGGRSMFRQGSDLAKIMEECFDLRQTIIWDKTAIGPGVYYRTQYEAILMASNGRVGIWEGGRAKANVLRCKRVRTWPQGHPTPKPVELLKELIANSSRPKDLVLDPFAGSGATAAAAKALGRKFIAIDISPQWAAEATDRHGLIVKDLTT